MTPTLFGRWQTRIFLLATIGLLVTWGFASGIFGTERGNVYYWVLLYYAVIGLAWDILYNYLQKFMWDHDWPGAFQLLAGIAEGILLAILAAVGVLPNVSDHFDLLMFTIHYASIWVAVYLASWVVMRLLFPRWRFRGGEWVGKWRRTS
ncbi:MAG: hypothetical protein HC769_17290 [Cyanobacteria bacterium CRU_2_1]|nr:hypothetical protein [Cyanobacteria bacterium RU_5_0]NJR60426.1 hypothetical protein [Cyanobacteria bacterium CRU_2_1]